MSTSRLQKLINRKRRIEHRLRPRPWTRQHRPMFQARNIQYELSERLRGLGPGGLGLVHHLARRVGLIAAIDRRLQLLKVHLPYHESDHVLNVAYNILSGGTCLEDLELWRNDEVYLDALGAQRIPDPTTEGDFCRRFAAADVETLQDIFNDVRLDVWRQQPAGFFARAILDVDGVLAETYGECKAGIGRAYDGTWGYHPLVVSLANTQEPLYLANRPGNRPSNEGAAAYLDRAIVLCRRAGFKQILLRGDTDFSQTTQLDRWNRAGVHFLFGLDARASLIQRAENLPPSAWKTLQRAPKYAVKTSPRRRPVRVKEQIVVAKGYQNIKLEREAVTSMAYRPDACQTCFTLVVLRKNLAVERGQRRLFDDVRYFFYLTNLPAEEPADLVYLANDRCNQENLLEQLRNGVRALNMPVDGLVSNWAYMVMASLAWSLKAWFALRLPERGRWKEKYRHEKRQVLTMEFKRFVNAFIRVPCQIVRAGRRLVYRLLAWNPWQEVFARGLAALDCPLRC